MSEIIELRKNIGTIKMTDDIKDIVQKAIDIGMKYIGKSVCKKCSIDDNDNNIHQVAYVTAREMNIIYGAAIEATEEKCGHDILKLIGMLTRICASPEQLIFLKPEALFKVEFTITTKEIYWMHDICKSLEGEGVSHDRHHP